jgi:hypothetical protein
MTATVPPALAFVDQLYNLHRIDVGADLEHLLIGGISAGYPDVDDVERCSYRLLLVEQKQLGGM